MRVPVPGGRFAARARPVIWACLLILSLGAIGLCLLLPSLRARRHRHAQRCQPCRRNHILLRTAVSLVAIVMVAGAAARAQEFASPMPHCGRTWYLGEIEAAQPPRPGVPYGWALTRQVVTAPLSGIAEGFARARGMGLCRLGGMTVAFLPGAAITTGTTIGDMFLTRVDERLSTERLRALSRHESRHVDQWTVLTLAGGPTALPALYTVDEIFFQDARNHFERDAGLAEGGYEHASSTAPNPQWAGVAALGMALLVLARRRVRWISRLPAHGTSGLRARQSGRCPLHSKGWFRRPQLSGAVSCGRLRAPQLRNVAAST